MAEKHFFEQRKHTENYLIPYFDRYIPEWRSFRILEAGCAEAGFLDVLHRLNINVAGIELSQERVKLAKGMNSELDVHVGDLTDPTISNRFSQPFDMIVLRDVVEHIPTREALFNNLSKLLGPEGYLYITFPPRFSPFAGHHQNGRSMLKRVPYLHLLPAWKIRMLGRWFREYEHITENAILNYRTGLTIRKFEKLCKRFGFKSLKSEYFISRPVYRTRFGWRILHYPNIPVLREIFALGCECLLKAKGKQDQKPKTKD